HLVQNPVDHCVVNEGVNNDLQILSRCQDTEDSHVYTETDPAHTHARGLAGQIQSQNVQAAGGVTSIKVQAAAYAAEDTTCYGCSQGVMNDGLCGDRDYRGEE